MSSQEFAEAEERLGANVSATNTADRSYAMLNALSANLAPSLDLLSDFLCAPAFNPPEVERVKKQALTGIEQLQKDPTRLASRVMPGVLYGANHPYGGPAGGDPKAIARFTRDDLIGWKDRWLRPDNAKIFIVSSLPLTELQPQLESRFGRSWAAPAVAKGVKRFTAPPPRPNSPRILLVDRVGAPQATIAASQIIPVDPRSDVIPLSAANRALGGDFLSRLNMNLREEKGWSYGIGGRDFFNENAATYAICAPVHFARPGDALAEINRMVGEFTTTKGLTDDELTRIRARAINELPGQFETAGAVISAMMGMDVLGRPDNYYDLLPGKYRALTPAAADAALRAAVDPKGFTWVVVGDAAKIRPQLEKLGMPIEVVEAP
jgi:predicted Zn-dependent peptidase